MSFRSARSRSLVVSGMRNEAYPYDVEYMFSGKRAFSVVK